MTESSDRSFMSDYCVAYRSGLERPFSVDGFDCATNGHVLLMMPGATFEPNANAPALAKTLATKLAKAATVPFQALRRWGFTAGHLHATCEVCTSKSEQLITVGLLCGRRVNRRLLGKALFPLRAETVNVHIGEELEPLLIECSEWRLFVMPVKCAEGDAFEFPGEHVKKERCAK